MKRPRISELDSEIARLEAELAAAEDESESSSSDDEDNSDSDSSASGAGHGAIISSNWAESERIAPLPKKSLPAASCSVSVGQKRATKRARVTHNPPPTRTVPDWLDPSLYVPSQNRELYCRVCVFQASSIEELQEHRRSPAHISKERAEAAHTFCKLCKKQFTSVAQLAEHKKGKWHIMRAQRGSLGSKVHASKGQGRGQGQGWGKGASEGKSAAKGRGRGSANDFGKGMGKGQGVMGKGKGKGKGRGRGNGKGTWTQT